jgi:hypothetical protein
MFYESRLHRITQSYQLEPTLIQRLQVMDLDHYEFAVIPKGNSTLTLFIQYDSNI